AGIASRFLIGACIGANIGAKILRRPGQLEGRAPPDFGEARARLSGFAALGRVRAARNRPGRRSPPPESRLSPPFSAAADRTAPPARRPRSSGAGTPPRSPAH